jgi:hypothetical protein
MVEHVAYEINQLHRTAALVSSGKYPTAGGTDLQRVLGNALLESTLIHLRSLDDFLGMTAPKDSDDVLAIDYLPGWRPKRVLTVAERKYINKRVQHLTTVRRTGPAPWAMARCNDVLAEVIQFMHALEAAQPQRAAWFKQWMAWST